MTIEQLKQQQELLECYNKCKTLAESKSICTVEHIPDSDFFIMPMREYLPEQLANRIKQAFIEIMHEYEQQIEQQ